jgi:hypothetical protein
MAEGLQLPSQLIRGTTMTSTDLIESAEDKPSELEKSAANVHKLPRPGTAFQQSESSDFEISPEDFTTRLRQISKISMSEVSQLINELQLLRKKLQTGGDRIQPDIEAYTDLSQQVMQITSIMTDSVKKLPTSQRISP